MTLINPLLGGNLSSGFNTELIENSMWLDGTADYFSRTPAVAGNTSKWIVAFWVRRNRVNTGAAQNIISAGTATSNLTWIRFDDADFLDFAVYQGSVTARKTSAARYRDIAWYHVCISFDSGSAVNAADRIKMFVNGNEVTDFSASTSTPTDETTAFNGNVLHEIGRYSYNGTEDADVSVAQFCMIEGKSFQSNNITINDILDSFEFGNNGSQFGPQSNAALTALTADAFGSNSFALDFSDSAYLGHDSRPHNLIKHSQQLSEWTDSSGTDVVLNSLVAPDGSKTADQIKRSASASSVWTGRTSATGVVETSTVYTVSAYFKQDSPGANYPLINFINAASPYENRAQVLMLFSSGTLTLSHWGGSAKVGNPVFTDSGNGWWRVSFQVLTSSTATSYYVNVMPNGGQTGTDPVGVWGIQVEQGGLSPYVPTPKNILFHTQQFNNGYWQKLNGSTITADQAVAPDGTTTADLATAGNAVYGSLFARRYLSETYDVLPSTQYTLSCYVKKTNYRYIQLRNPTSREATFDFDTKTFLNISTTVDATGYEDVGNGWFRIWSTATQPATGQNALVDIAFANSAGTSGFTPAGTETVYIWGAQFETGGLSTYREIAGSNAVNVVPNNFTPNSITAVNQSKNTPSNEFPSLNPINGDASLVAALANDNLLTTTYVHDSGVAWDSVFATRSMGRTGKYYYEVRIHRDDGGDGFPAGIHETDTANKNWAHYIGNTTATYGLGYGIYSAGGSGFYTNGSVTSITGYSSELVAGDIVMMAVDLNNSKIYWGRNGTFFNSGNPANNTGESATIQANTDYIFGVSPPATEDYYVNFGADSTFGGTTSAGGNSDSKGVGNFKYAVPTGFLSLASAALDTPTLQGIDNFSVTLATEEALNPTKNWNPYSENANLNYTTVSSTNYPAFGARITNNVAPDPNGILTADKIEDNSTSSSMYVQKNITISVGKDTWTWSFYIQKDTNTSRRPRFVLGLHGGSANQFLYCYLNTSTGVVENASGGSALTSAVSESVGDYWKLSLTGTNNGGNTLIYTQVYPAHSTTSSQSSDHSLTGHVIFAHSQVVQNAPAVLPIDDSASVVSGNMTNGGGLSAIFDGDRTKNNSQSASGANTNSNDSFVIVDHGSPKNVAAFTAFASTDAQGFDGDSGGSTITFTLAGSTDNFSSSNVTLFSDTVADGAGKVYAINSSSTSGSQRITLGAYRYHKMTVQTNTTNSGQKYGQLAQLEFFESTVPTAYIPTYDNGAVRLPFTHTLDLIDGTTTENYIRNNTMEVVASTTTHTVTVADPGSGNKFYINGVQQATLNLSEGNIYIFNYPSGHPFRFSTTANGTHAGGTEYVQGVTYNTSTQITIVVPAGAPTLYYYCSLHSNMGGTANTPVSQTIPTNWFFSSGGGSATVEIVGYGVTLNGIDYVDIKFSGTPINDPYINFEGTSDGILTSPSQLWSMSGYLALQAGSMTNITNIQFIRVDRTITGSYITAAAPLTITPTSALNRYEGPTTTSSGGTVARLTPKLNINWDGSGAIDATFRIGNPQMEKRSHASQMIKTGAHTMRQNLLTYSEQLDQWINVNTVRVANALVAPDGSQTADTIAQGTGSTYPQNDGIRADATLLPSTLYTFSGYFKHSESNTTGLHIGNYANSPTTVALILYTWSGGSPTLDSSTNASNIVLTDVGNGWHRLSFSFTTFANASQNNQFYLYPRRQSAEGTDVVGMWGMQLEIGSTANTYIPTTTAAVFEPTKRTSLNSFVEIQKNRDAIETWAWRFSHDHNREYAVSTTATYQAIRDQTGTNNWFSHAIRIAPDAGTAAGAVSHGFATGHTVVTHGLTSSRYAVLLFPRANGNIHFYHPDLAAGKLLVLNSDAGEITSNAIRDITTTSFSIDSGVAQGVYDYLVLEDGGLAAMGTYVGNASGAGPYISLPHSSALFTRRSAATCSFWTNNFKSPGFNENGNYTRWNDAQAEGTGSLKIDMLAGAVKIRDTYADQNSIGVTYYYISLGDITGGGDLPPIYGR